MYPSPSNIGKDDWSKSMRKAEASSLGRLKQVLKLLAEELASRFLKLL